LVVHNLSKSYGALLAADEVSFTVGAGEVVALLGPNGSGKTTCLRCSAGLLQADRGTISIAGCDLQRDYRRARQSFSYLPQQASFAASLRVHEILSFHARLRGLPLERCSTALAEAGLSESDAQRFVGQLSGGMRQRVSLAVACLAEAPLILLDEPTASLDPQAALHFRALARQWRTAGRALLLSTHVLTDVEELADRVVVLVAGRKVAEESIGELKARLSRCARLRVDVGQPTLRHCEAALECGADEARLNSHAVLVTAPVERRLAILQRLRELGDVYRFDTEQPTLEDVYLEYVRGGTDAQ
jgi:ABC-type multidrug transport system ATPase subunit